MEIIANGSKWGGEDPDTLEILIDTLKKHDLDVKQGCMTGFMSFDDNTPKESKNSFIDLDDENITISGNFMHLSHVFNIRGTYRELDELRCAIEDNIKRIFKEKLKEN